VSQWFLENCQNLLQQSPLAFVGVQTYDCLLGKRSNPLDPAVNIIVIDKSSIKLMILVLYNDICTGQHGLFVTLASKNK